ncbi:MAG: MBL fold metallo-hydrolase [Hyphomonadaceae bacterium]
MKRILVFTGVVLVVAAAAFATWRVAKAPIAEFAFQRAVKAGAGVNMADELPDGLHVFLCGSGSPMPDPTRAGPCVGVLAGRHALVFDTGSGSPRRLARMGFPVGDIERVFLTHLHSDHFDSLGELLLQAWVGGPRDTPMPVMGPGGVASVVQGFNDAYRIDSTFRTAHHGPEVANPSGFGGAGEAIALPAGAAAPVEIWSNDGVVVSAFVVDHRPVEPAFGYRIDYGGRSVVLSGDTVYSTNTVAAAKGADLLMHEALQPRMVHAIQTASEQAGRPNIARIMHDIPDYHSTPADAARVAQEAGVKALILYHIVPPLPSPLLNDMFLDGARKQFDGSLTIGRDGLLASLPAESDKITIKILD